MAENVESSYVTIPRTEYDRLIAAEQLARHLLDLPTDAYYKTGAILNLVASAKRLFGN